ncbi:hypothetical protein GQR58_029785 [Nymphon striatum]|nr:hypothetical protein GQR58_029785 [Nymphon striatum]
MMAPKAICSPACETGPFWMPRNPRSTASHIKPIYSPVRACSAGWMPICNCATTIAWTCPTLSARMACRAIMTNMICQALANLADLDAALTVVETSKNPLRRAYFANEAYKDLTDLMVHLAPAVHSVGLLAGEDIGTLSPQVKTPFVDYYNAMKLAQVADINSAGLLGGN